MFLNISKSLVLIENATASSKQYRERFFLSRHGLHDHRTILSFCHDFIELVQ